MAIKAQISNKLIQTFPPSTCKPSYIKMYKKRNKTSYLKTKTTQNNAGKHGISTQTHKRQNRSESTPSTSRSSLLITNKLVCETRPGGYKNIKETP